MRCRARDLLAEPGVERAAVRQAGERVEQREPLARLAQAHHPARPPGRKRAAAHLDDGALRAALVEAAAGGDQALDRVGHAVLAGHAPERSGGHRDLPAVDDGDRLPERLECGRGERVAAAEPRPGRGHEAGGHTCAVGAVPERWLRGT